MSRICVKGLPKGATEAQLRAHFLPLGDLTDVKIVRSKTGASRQFAFIGYKDEAAAARAVAYFNRSFMGTSKLAVEAAREIGDDSVLQKTWSRHTAKKAAHEEKAAAAGGKRPAAAAAADKDAAQRAEYVALASARARSGASWANDDAGAAPSVAKKGAKAAAAGGGGDDDDDGASTDSGEYADMGAAADEADEAGGSDADVSVGKARASSSAAAGAASKPSAALKNKKAASSSALSDMDFLKSHVVSSFSDDDEDGDGNGGAADEEMGGDDEPAVKTAASTSGVGRKRSAKAAATTGGDDDEMAAPASKRKRAGSAGSAGAHDDDVIDAAATGVGGTVADVADSGRLFVRNLPFAASEDELRAHFGRWGPLAEVKLPLERGTLAKHRGFALVTYMIPEHAVAALSGADGRPFQGRILHVLPAQPPRETPTEGKGGEDGGGDGADGDSHPTGGGTSSFKRQQEAKRRAGAGSEAEQASVWHTLFVRADTSLAATASRLGLSKSELLGADRADAGASGSGGMAVRLALAEAAVVAETKEFLAREGVALGRLEAALEASIAAAAAAKDKMAAAGGGKAAAPAAAAAPPAITRSDCVLLVKNLPHDADAGALRELFSRHGALVRFSLPPSRALALVEFAQPKAAKRAFSSLAYTRFQRQPLYLEWAPEGVYTAPAPAAPAAAAAPAPAAASSSSSLASAAPAAAPSADAPAAAADASASSSSSSSAAAPSTDGRTLFVKNLAFATTEDGLRALFAKVGPLRSVRIPKRRNPKYKPGAAAAEAAGKKGAKKGAAPAAGDDSAQEWLSMGYGFVEFTSAADAGQALRMLQATDLDGHALQLKLSVGPGSGSSSGAAAAAAPAAPAAAKGPPPPAPSSAATKVLVRNLAFEATRKDVAELAGAFGTVKSVRLPKKMDGSHRGFAFVEFLTHGEAAAAMASLGTTHLYGRHLVCEWATAGDASGAGVGASS